jgi:hypothetical protein
MEASSSTHDFLKAPNKAPLVSSRSLSSIATALISYRYPDLTDIYYLGFCHGPAGSARLFYQLFKVTKRSGLSGVDRALGSGHHRERNP